MLFEKNENKQEKGPKLAHSLFKAYFNWSIFIKPRHDDVIGKTLIRLRLSIRRRFSVPLKILNHHNR